MKDLTLIALLLLVGSGYFMRQQYPYTSTKSENNLKMFSSESELKTFYLDTLYRKRNIVCNQCLPLDEHSPITKLTQYYRADFLFLFCYSFLFATIAIYYRKHKVGRFENTIFYNIIIGFIILTFICDIGENICMLQYISNNFESYTPFIRYLNIVKSVGFLVLFFVLIVRYPKSLIEGFNSCISTY